jgi:hypothetical protein
MKQGWKRWMLNAPQYGMRNRNSTSSQQTNKIMLEYKCQSCLHSYDGADGVLRCRVHPQAMPCFEVLVENCKRFIYEPGTDADETTQAETLPDLLD